MAALSRLVVGISRESLIVCLPGSVKGCIENLEALLGPLLDHALNLIGSDSKVVENDHKRMQDTAHENVGSINTFDDIHNYTANMPLSVSSRSRVSPYPLVEFKDALDLVHANSIKRLIEECEVHSNLCGHALAETVVSTVNIPECNVSLVDGYAFKSPGACEMRVCGSSTPAVSALAAIGQNEVVRITTGGAIPNGCDSIIMVDDTSIVSSTESGEESVIRLNKIPKPGQYLRSAGSELKSGQTLVEKDTLLSVYDIGSLMSARVLKVRVFKYPSIGIFSTGDEIGVGVVDTNLPILTKLFEQNGFCVKSYNSVKDEPLALESIIKRAISECVIVISSGGVSMGEHDHVKSTLIKLGASIHFGRVNLKTWKANDFCNFRTWAPLFWIAWKPSELHWYFFY